MLIYIHIDCIIYGGDATAAYEYDLYWTDFCIFFCFD